MNTKASLSACSPTSEDLLNFSPSINTLASLLGALKPPFTIGIYGAWGSGKTSYMRMLEKKLTSDKAYCPFWFNAWKYENEGSLVLPLLSKMSEKYKSNHAIKDKFDNVKKLLTALTLVGANVGLKAITGGAVRLKDVETALVTAEDHLLTACDKWIDKCDKLETSFKELINTITDNEKHQVVIFIDDLDRCAPENVIQLLESIKNFLSLEDCRCLFIIGVDKEVLVKGIKAKYGEALIDGSDYLEKIINYSIEVPSSAVGNALLYVTETFKDQLKPEVVGRLEPEIALISKAVSIYGISNPRKLKRVISRLILFLIDGESLNYLIGIIVYLVLLRELLPEVYTSKKENGSIVFRPFKQVNKDKTLSDEEFVRHYGKDWFELLFKDTHPYVKLRDIQDSLCNKFAAQMPKSLEESIDGLKRHPESGLRAEHDRIIALYQKGIVRSGNAYFAKVDSLFTLTLSL